MRRSVALTGSAVFFALAPGVVAGLIPWWLTGWHVRTPTDGWAWLVVASRVVGAVLIAAGAVVVVGAFVRFAVEGLGTPAPVAPPDVLVVGGLFRYIRNPMYVAVLTCILGQAMVLWQPGLLLYGAIAGAMMFAFVRLYEEPALTLRFGEQYRAYRRAVPGWWPRRRPWSSRTDGA